MKAKLADLLKTRTTDDLLALVQDHESGEFKLAPSHIAAVRRELYSRPLPESICRCSEPTVTMERPTPCQVCGGHVPPAED